MQRHHTHRFGLLHPLSAKAHLHVRTLCWDMDINSSVETTARSGQQSDHGHTNRLSAALDAKRTTDWLVVEPAFASGHLNSVQAVTLAT